MYPILLQTEDLLAEAFAHYEHTWAFAMCRKRHEGCEAEIARVVPPKAQLQGRFDRLIAELGDPAIRAPLEARFADALERGDLERKAWAKPRDP